jgi:hypothetical protein
MAAVVASTLIFAMSLAAQAPALKLDLGDLSSRAKEVVNVSIDKNTVDWAMQALNSKGADAEKLRELMKELDGITVQALEFDRDKGPAWEELLAAAQGVIRQMDGAQWKSIVSAEEKGTSPELVRVSLFTDAAGQVGGLGVLAVERSEIVLVNIVGNIRLDQLETIGKALGQPGMFGALGGAKSPARAK